MKCFIAHKFIQLGKYIICEKCGQEWESGETLRKVESTENPAIILTKKPNTLEDILYDNYPTGEQHLN
jgi:hypothetical protein